MRFVSGLLILGAIMLVGGGVASAAELGEQKPADVQCGCIHGDRLSKPDLQKGTGTPVPGGVTATTGTLGV